jgi:hypothetical protein
VGGEEVSRTWPRGTKRAAVVENAYANRCGYCDITTKPTAGRVTIQRPGRRCNAEAHCVTNWSRDSAWAEAGQRLVARRGWLSGQAVQSRNCDDTFGARRCGVGRRDVVRRFVRGGE